MEFMFLVEWYPKVQRWRVLRSGSVDGPHTVYLGLHWSLDKRHNYNLMESTALSPWTTYHHQAVPASSNTWYIYLYIYVFLHYICIYIYSQKHP